MINLDGVNLDRLSIESRQELRRLLHALTASAQNVLHENLVGLYLVGSFAMGGGDQHSDVDFLTVTAEPLAHEQLSALRELHGQLPAETGHWNRHLEGSYVTVAQLHEAPGSSSWWYVDNGSPKVVSDPHDNTATARWILWHHGHPLAGPRSTALLGDVPAATLRAEARSNIEIWRRLAESDPGSLRNAWLQQHAVLTYCRIRFTLATGSVTTKLDAGDWALAELGPNWTRLIDRAIADRPHPWDRVHQEVDGELARVTCGFLTSEVHHQTSG